MSASRYLSRKTDRELRVCLEDIRDLRVEVTFPFLLGVYEEYKQERLAKEEVIEIFRLIESYVFRRAICGIPAQGLNKIFVELTGQIEREQIDTNDYIQSLKVADFLADDRWQAFPFRLGVQRCISY